MKPEKTLRYGGDECCPDCGEGLNQCTCFDELDDVPDWNLVSTREERKAKHDK